MSDRRFKGGQWTVAVSGLEVIFKILCFIAKLIIYHMTIDKPIDRKEKKRLEKELEVIRYGEDW